MDNYTMFCDRCRNLDTLRLFCIAFNNERQRELNLETNFLNHAGHVSHGFGKSSVPY